MTEQELKEDIAKVIAANVLYRGKPVFHWDFSKLAEEIHTRYQLAGYVKLSED